MGDVRIKPCPFCGSHVVDLARTNDNACWVECSQCGAHTESHRDRAGAITLWNGRVNDDNKTTTVDYDQDYEHWEWFARHQAAMSQDPDHA